MSRRADRIHQLLARRTKVEDQIATELQAAKIEMGTEAWLAWCAREFGWGRSTAYIHLDPLLLAKKRAEDRNRQASVRDSRTSGHEALVVEMINAGFKRLAAERHPDVGGTHEQMSALSAARDWGVAFIESGRRPGAR